MKKSSTLRKLAWYSFCEIKHLLFGTVYRAEFDITDNCNLRCKHCYYFQGKKRFMKDDVPLHEWERRFKELRDAGIRFVLMGGGEPGLRRDVLRLADKMFPLVYVISNGTIKIPKEFDNRLFVSIDGRKAVNDSIRGEGVFSKVIGNYSGDKRVVLNMTLSPENYRELEDVILIAKENNFRGVVCNVHMAAALNTGPAPMDQEARKKIISEMRRVKKIYPDFFLMSEDMMDWYDSPRKDGHCDWSENALHFDVSWKKRECFMEKPDCKNCGCLSGAEQSPLRALRYPKERIKFS